MKLLFFVDSLLPGGIQTLLYNLTIKFKRIEPSIKIDFLCFDEDAVSDMEDEMCRMGCGVYKVQIPHIQTLCNTLNDLDEFFRNHNDYDLIHAHCSSKGLLPLFFAKRYGIKHRIVHSHNTKFQSQNPATIFIGNILKAPLCRIATDYFACGELAGKWLFNNSFARKDIRVKILNNGIFIEKFIYDLHKRKAVRDELGINPTTKVVGNIGRFVPQKNHVFMINLFDAFHKLVPDSKLILVGDGELMKQTKIQVEDLGISDSVLFAGIRSDADRFYQAFDLFLMPSLYEGLPFVGIEAQAAGLPCLFSDTVTKEVAVLSSTEFESLNTSKEIWTERMKNLIEDTIRKDTSEEMSAAGYNIELEAQKLYDYYKATIINGKTDNCVF